MKYSRLKNKKELALSKSKGFTLIEILVTITIVSLLLIVSIPNFRNYKYRNDLSRAAEFVQSGIYETRNLALAPNTNKPEDVKYYVFKADKDAKSFAIYEADDLPDVNDLATLNLLKTFSLPNSVIFTNDAVIYFSIEEQGKIKQLIGNPIVVKHDKIQNNNTKNININSVTGQVTIE